MLATLRIKNLALVDDLTLELAPGYNAITGETGAGKSVIMGALNLVLGERADRTLIRSGAESCSVEAAFALGAAARKLNAFLDAKGLEPCEEGELLLKRTFTASGTNKQFVNGSPTSLAVLAELGDWLVDMHGPHEHQSLLHASRQLQILDAYGALESAREKFADLLRKRKEIQEAKAALIVDEKTYAQQLDLLRFQVNEIASAKLRQGEDAELDSEYRRASNAARLIELAQGALATMGEEEGSLLTQAGAVGRQVAELTRLDSQAGELAELHRQALGLFQELQRALSQYSDHVEVDPARLSELEDRLNLVQSLKRKYGSTLAEVIGFGNEAARKLHALESRDEEVAKLNAVLAENEKRLWEAGRELSEARRKLIPKLSKAVVKQLQDLGFKQSLFDVAIRSAIRHEAFAGTISESGFDQIEFQFAPNPGEPARPLRAIASSGELARVMLALKTVLADQDEVEVLVFDEVDANVGGETAVAVGEKMRQIAGKHQVLCITHLAPVAAAANTHFVVAKQIRDGRTISSIERVEEKHRVAELARMLGGHGEAARKHAEALLKR